MPAPSVSSTCDPPAGDLRTRKLSQAGKWRPGLASFGEMPCHSEVFASGRDASGAAAALALAFDDLRHVPKLEGQEASDRRAILWVQTKGAARLGGRPFRAGLPDALRHRLIHVLAETAQDALFAIEEGMRCREVAFVLGEIAGNPAVLDFTASRRLTLAGKRHGVSLYLVRLDAAQDLSSARMRWSVAAAPSAMPEWDRNAPGAPAWTAHLFRARGYRPGSWRLSESHDGLVADRAVTMAGETPPARALASAG